MTQQFEESQFAKFKQPGTGRIIGQAFLKTRGGDVKVGAGNTVTLVPITPYTREFVEALKSNTKISGFDERAREFFRETVGDASGNFEFNQLPAGEYYLHCVLTWEIPGAYGIPIQTGGVLRREVLLGEEEIVRVLLTR